MASTHDQSERRQHKRFQVKSGAVAVLRPDYAKRGQIINISEGGLAFSYLAREETPNGSSNLDILLSDISFYLGNVPIKNISDFEIASKEPSNFVRMRRHAVQFGRLNNDQIAQLEFFIMDYTMGEA